MAPKKKGKGGEKASRPVTPPAASVPTSAPPSSAPANQTELEFELQNALLTYPHWRLTGMHRHFILFGLMEYLERRLKRRFTSDEVLQLLDRCYNLDHMTVDHKEVEMLKEQKEFSLPPEIFVMGED
ncbi:unnamed protein product [Sphagnum jensenii]|uniref:Uncharacterized protein n=1 Tax=Sphagnum jensenii TaxID=128206 RepID=A0ABP1BH27_9BRYO